MRPAGLVKLTNQASGTSASRTLGVIEQDRDGAQGHGEAAGAGRLLAEDAVLEGDTLVGDAVALLPDPDRAEDEGCSLRRRGQIRLGGDGECRTALGGDVAGEGAHGVQAVGIGVEEGDLRQAQGLLPLDQAVEEQGGADPRADDEQFQRSSPIAPSVAAWFVRLVWPGWPGEPAGLGSVVREAGRLGRMGCLDRLDLADFSDRVRA